ncbi:outer membrane beta-barrel protein [Flavobacterium chungangensis]|uniref:Outer membrane beta-barrel protein n=1 Tax=Flavobacterium chungangensis TaxID=2708132 RepID=A0ABV8ZLA2_9FLAO
MKKSFFLAIAVMVFGFVNAQNTKFGIKGGVQLSSLVGNIENETPKLGIQLGGFAEFRVAKGLFIQPEILYSTQGATYEKSGVDYFYKQRI